MSTDELTKRASEAVVKLQAKGIRLPDDIHAKMIRWLANMPDEKDIGRAKQQLQRPEVQQTLERIRDEQ